MEIKSVRIRKETHKLLSDVKAKRKSILNPAWSIADIIHELISKAHKREIKSNGSSEEHY